MRLPSSFHFTLGHLRRGLPCWLIALVLGFPAVRALAADDFLDPEVAFTLTARPLDDRRVELLFTAAPGYYLYRDQFKFVGRGATLDAPVMPDGHVKFDETFQKNVETYRGLVRIVIAARDASPEFTVLTTNQGCADKGLCYPPTERAVRVSLAGFGGSGYANVLNAAQTASTLDNKPGVSQDLRAGNDLDSVLRGGRFWSVVGVFFVAGVLLSLTPCMLPMLPILSSIIVGEGPRVSRSHGLAMAASYSFGMALVYTALGIAAGLAGEGLAAALQSPWVLSVFAAGLVALSLSMFGVYELQLPGALTGRLTAASQRLPGGKAAGVFLMGGVSAMIVSPCVAAPLAGALVYLSQTRDVWLGGTALFCLAAGMSVPLIVVGSSAGALLPRAGPWMDEVKRFFGLVLLGVALWTIQSVFPGPLVLSLWGALGIAAAVVLVSPRPGERPHADAIRRPPPEGIGQSRKATFAHERTVATAQIWRRAGAAVLAVCGLLQWAGAASGGSNPLQPLAGLSARLGGSPSLSGPVFARVRNIDELNAEIRAAGRPVMLDFYADWCVSCKEMERFTYAEPAVRRKLANAVLLKADVTANNANDRELLKRFNLFGPPGTIFFDAQGSEVAAARVIGFQDGERFSRSLDAAGL